LRSVSATGAALSERLYGAALRWLYGRLRLGDKPDLAPELGQAPERMVSAICTAWCS
jgi:hypothetical protein